MSEAYELRAPGYSHRDLETSIRGVLDGAAIGAVATIAAEANAPHVTPAYLASDDSFTLVFASSESKPVERNLAGDDRVAVTVWSDAAERAGRRRALQLYGTARRLRDKEESRAIELLRGRLEAPASGPLGASLVGRNTPLAVFSMRVASARLVDEERFARGAAIAIYVDRGAHWTERLAASA